MRDVLGTRTFGPELYKLGRSAHVIVVPTESQWLFELQSEAGKARLSEPDATIFSHLMSKPLDEIEQMIKVGVQE